MQGRFSESREQLIFYATCVTDMSSLSKRSYITQTYVFRFKTINLNSQQGTFFTKKRANPPTLFESIPQGRHN